MTRLERESITRDLDPPFTVHRPRRLTSPIVFCSPHSGRSYPSALIEASQLDATTLRKSEDSFVEALFASAPDHGAALIEAHFPRAYLDVNREPYELDPELFEDPLPDYANVRTMRVIGGLGTVARIVSETEEIYPAKIPLSVAIERIERLYKPFHAALLDLLEEARSQFGFSILIDCHSMPSGDVSLGGASRPDFVIGDRFGSSCDGRLTRLVRRFLNDNGYRVQLNRPYAGGYITEHYGQPFAHQHALQLEINRGLYMNERTYSPSLDFEQLRHRMEHLIDVVTTHVHRLSPAKPEAAE
ncbi:MAG: N-formylglutamate amidohydrolase [Pseudomonadota bacterium]